MNTFTINHQIEIEKNVKKKLGKKLMKIDRLNLLNEK